MRALTLESPGPPSRGPLVQRERADPSAGAGELLLEVTACGVCRTDLQLCVGDLKAKRLPIIPGHQIVGRVLSVGAGVTHWKVGDRAGVGWLASTCGVCHFCRRGSENLCERAVFTGWSVDGGFATQVVVGADFAFKLPEHFPDIDAAPLLCGGVIGYRSLKRSGIAPGGRLGLYGFGASAWLAMQVARYWGCRVFVATWSKAEQSRARDLGAEWTGTYDELPPEPLDAAISFAPTSEVAANALQALGPGGTLAINAIHLEGPLTFAYEALWWERNVVSVANYTRDDARELLALAAEIPLVTRRSLYRFSEANQALVDLQAGRVEGAAVLTP